MTTKEEEAICLIKCGLLRRASTQRRYNLIFKTKSFLILTPIYSLTFKTPLAFINHSPYKTSIKTRLTKS